MGDSSEAEGKSEDFGSRKDAEERREERSVDGRSEHETEGRPRGSGVAHQWHHTDDPIGKGMDQMLANLTRPVRNKLTQGSLREMGAKFLQGALIAAVLFAGAFILGAGIMGDAGLLAVNGFPVGTLENGIGHGADMAAHLLFTTTGGLATLVTGGLIGTAILGRKASPEIENEISAKPEPEPVIHLAPAKAKAREPEQAKPEPATAKVEEKTSVSPEDERVRKAAADAIMNEGKWRAAERDRQAKRNCQGGLGYA